MAAKKDATYIDMFDTKEFPRSDFCDTVHLHSGGGAKFLDALARRLSANHAVISGLNVNRQDDEGSSIAGLEGQGL